MLAAMFTCSQISAGMQQQEEFNIQHIPTGLLKGAGAVVRKDMMTFRMEDEESAVLSVTKAVTIFRRDERHYGELVLQYGAFSTIDDLDGAIFDAQGRKVKELENKDTQDFSAFSGYSLFEENRMRTAALYHDQYPYTIVFKYEISFEGYLNWPTWYGQHSSDPVELSRFEVVVPEGYDLRFWCNRDSLRPMIMNGPENRHYVWEVKLLPFVVNEAIGDLEDISPIVRIAPTLFKLEGYEGSMLTWNDFGKWFHELWKERDRLPDDAVQVVQSLIQQTDGVREKIEKLYRYMQSKSRYVSVQLGIGGWQPFDAEFVHERGYGDCKALVNYMSALLKEAGVVAYPVLIRNGGHRNPMIREFPSNQFNHVILCIPMDKDSLWLECTSQSILPGFVGSSNESRSALLITPEGGIVVNMPESTFHSNSARRMGLIRLSANGNAEARMETVVRGNQQVEMRSALAHATPRDREKWSLNSLDVPNVSLKRFDVDGLETRNPELTTRLECALQRFASPSGSRLFFQPNLANRQSYVPPEVPTRISPVRISYAYRDVDSILYMLPEGYVAEALPDSVNLTSSFGAFASKTVMMGDTCLLFLRSEEVHKSFIPAESYREYRQFFLEMVKADRGQAVLVKKEGL